MLSGNRRQSAININFLLGANRVDWLSICYCWMITLLDSLTSSFNKYTIIFQKLHSYIKFKICFKTTSGNSLPFSRYRSLLSVVLENNQAIICRWICNYTQTSSFTWNAKNVNIKPVLIRKHLYKFRRHIFMPKCVYLPHYAFNFTSLFCNWEPTFARSNTKYTDRYGP